MRKRIFTLLVVAVLALSGCGNQNMISSVSNTVVSEKANERIIHSVKNPAAPSKPAAHKVLSTITLNNADGRSVSADLTMDEVPESYYTEPRHQGKIEKFYYTTNTYGIYGRPKKQIRKYAEVYLPYGYKKSGKYNIVYLMHGAGGSAERFFGSAQKPRTMKAILDNMTALGEIPPMIFVNLTYYPENGHKREQDWDIQYTKYYNKELDHDVLPQVEAHYATYAKSTSEKDLVASRNHRIFGGYSMGGLTTYYRMTDSMRYFHTFIAMSGSFYWGPDANGTRDKNFAAEYLMKAIRKEGYGPDDFFLYTATGTKDFALDVVKLQVESEQLHPEFFRFGQASDPGNSNISNCAYEIAEGEVHSGQHGSDRYLYNALPLLAKTLGEK